MERIAFTVAKSSFWNTEREIHDSAGGTIGRFGMTGWWWTTGEAEARGHQYRFGVDNAWWSQKTHMTDMSGQTIAHIAPKGWWGTEYLLTYSNQEYILKVNGWGTGFTLSQGGADIMRVREGGYFKPGSVTIFGSLADKDALILVLFGLFQLQIHASNASASGAAVSTAT